MDVLSTVDVEFMMFSCISAAYKVFGITNEIDINELAAFVGTRFPNNSITVANLIK